MKAIILLFAALCISCTSNNTESLENDVVSEIANSAEYLEIRKTRQEILQAMLDKKFDANEILSEIQKDNSFNTFCGISPKQFESKGIELYLSINCKLESQLESLKTKYPSFSNLSQDQVYELERTFNNLNKLPKPKIPTYE